MWVKTATQLVNLAQYERIEVRREAWQGGSKRYWQVLAYGVGTQASVSLFETAPMERQDPDSAPHAAAQEAYRAIQQALQEQQPFLDLSQMTTAEEPPVATPPPSGRAGRGSVFREGTGQGGSADDR